MTLDERIQAEIQLIQKVLERHHVQASVEGVEKHQKGVSFFVRLRRPTDTWQVRVLAEELAHAVGRPHVQVEEHPPLVVLRMGPRPRPVFLADIWDGLRTVPAGTVIIGKTLDDRPLHLNLAHREMVPVLVSGGTRSGKSALLRLIGLEIALTTSPRAWRVVLVGGLRPTLIESLRTLPHVWSPPMGSHHHPLPALSAFLADHFSADRPLKILVLVDDVEDVLTVTGRAGKQALLWLLTEGPSFGVRTVVVSRRVHTLPDALRRPWAIHLAGRPDFGVPLPPEYEDVPTSLHPRFPGQFLLRTVSGIHLVRVAWVGQKVLRHVLTWYRRRRPVVFAGVASPELPAEEEEVWEEEISIPELRFNNGEDKGEKRI